MKYLTLLILVGVACGGGGALARVDDFSRYEIILSRRPFGEPPTEIQQPVIPKPVQTGPSFADSLKLVALTYNDGYVRVGFVDQKQKPPKTYFLFVGDRQDGIEVVSADYEMERVVLRKGNDERTLSMGSGGGSVVESVRMATSSDGRYGSAADGSSVGSERPTVRRVLSAGRRARLEEERRRAEMMPALHGKVLEKHLQEYNMQAIRTGAPPLPIQLTPEQDAQLVEEGVLPPME